jgi:hypothetical protein
MDVGMGEGPSPLPGTEREDPRRVKITPPQNGRKNISRGK